MTQHVMARRQVFRGAAGVAAGGVLTAGLGAAPAVGSEAHPHGLLGSWLIVHRNDPPAPAEPTAAVVSFAAGGVVISHDINPAGPPLTGTWAVREGGRFRATTWTGFAGGPNEPGGTARVQIQGRLRGDRISGTFTFTAFDPSGKQVDSGTGTFTGKPIDA